MITLDDVQGHWVRCWIKAPGFEDHATRVHWMQVGWQYCDVRIPKDRPDLAGAECLRDLPPKALARLAQAEGFAGHISLTGDRCTWHRVINWHGPSEVPDAGTIRFDDQGRMIEEGLHADYTELWENRGGTGPQALHVTGGGYTGYVMTRGDTFVMGIAKPDKPATGAIISALQQGQMPDGIEMLFDGLHAMGRWHGDTAIATLATQPFVEGTPVAARVDGGLDWYRTDARGAVTTVPLEQIALPP